MANITEYWPERGCYVWSSACSSGVQLLSRYTALAHAHELFASTAGHQHAHNAGSADNGDRRASHASASTSGVSARARLLGCPSLQLACKQLLDTAWAELERDAWQEVAELGGMMQPIAQRAIGSTQQTEAALTACLHALQHVVARAPRWAALDAAPTSLLCGLSEAPALKLMSPAAVSRLRTAFKALAEAWAEALMQVSSTLAATMHTAAAAAAAAADCSSGGGSHAGTAWLGCLRHYHAADMQLQAWAADRRALQGNAKRTPLAIAHGLPGAASLPLALGGGALRSMPTPPRNTMEAVREESEDGSHAPPAGAPRVPGASQGGRQPGQLFGTWESMRAAHPFDNSKHGAAAGMASLASVVAARQLAAQQQQHAASQQGDPTSALLVPFMGAWAVEVARLAVEGARGAGPEGAQAHIQAACTGALQALARALLPPRASGAQGDGGGSRGSSPGAALQLHEDAAGALDPLRMERLSHNPALLDVACARLTFDGALLSESGPDADASALLLWGHAHLVGTLRMALEAAHMPVSLSLAHPKGQEGAGAAGSELGWLPTLQAVPQPAEASTSAAADKGGSAQDGSSSGALRRLSLVQPGAGDAAGESVVAMAQVLRELLEAPELRPKAAGGSGRGRGSGAPPEPAAVSAAAQQLLATLLSAGGAGSHAARLQEQRALVLDLAQAGLVSLQGAANAASQAVSQYPRAAGLRELCGAHSGAVLLAAGLQQLLSLLVAHAEASWGQRLGAPTPAATLGPEPQGAPQPPRLAGAAAAEAAGGSRPSSAGSGRRSQPGNGAVHAYSMKGPSSAPGSRAASPGPSARPAPVQPLPAGTPQRAVLRQLMDWCLRRKAGKPGGKGAKPPSKGGLPPNKVAPLPQAGGEPAGARSRSSRPRSGQQQQQQQQLTEVEDFLPDSPDSSRAPSTSGGAHHHPPRPSSDSTGPRWAGRRPASQQSQSRPGTAGGTGAGAEPDGGGGDDEDLLSSVPLSSEQLRAAVRLHRQMTLMREVVARSSELLTAEFDRLAKQLHRQPADAPWPPRAAPAGPSKGASDAAARLLRPLCEAAAGLQEASSGFLVGLAFSSLLQVVARDAQAAAKRARAPSPAAAALLAQLRLDLGLYRSELSRLAALQPPPLASCPGAAAAGLALEPQGPLEEALGRVQARLDGLEGQWEALLGGKGAH